MFFFVDSAVQAQTRELSKFLSPDGANSSYFGDRVAVDGDTAVITASIPAVQNSLRGVAYVFVRNGDNWVFQARLMPDDWVPNDYLGSVAIDGDTILIGSPSNSNIYGAVYAFVRSGTTWTQQAKFSCTDCGGPHGFGQSISLEGDVALIGAPQQAAGRAYIFARYNGVWGQSYVLTPSDGALNDRFGLSVILEGETLVVGSPQNDIGTAGNQGSAYIFEFENFNWVEKSKLTNADGQANDRFGSELELRDGTLAVGVASDRVGANFGQGSVRLFSKVGASWTEQATLLASDGRSSDLFGSDIAIFGSTLVVSSRQNSVGANEGQGSVYVFVRDGGSWTEVTQLIASDGSAYEYFGNSVAIGPSGILVGNNSDRIGNVPNHGSAFYFRDPVSPPDLRPTSDSGISNSDNVTNHRDPMFDVKGLTIGSTFEVFRDGTLIHSATAVDTAATFSDPGAPPTGFYRYDVRKIINGQAGSPSPIIVLFDTTGPVITINQLPGDFDPTSASSVRFGVALSEPIVPGLSAGDLSIAESTANVSNATITLSTNYPGYWAQINNIQSDGLVKLTLPPAQFTDTAGNFYVSTILDNVITRDSVGPTVTMNQFENQADPASVLPIRYKVVFGEPVTGFDSQDILFNDSTASITRSQIAITGSGTDYIVTLNGASSDGGFMRLSVRLGAVADAAFNPNSASTSTDNVVVLDNVEPRVTINKASGQADPTNTLPVRYSVVFTEAVTGFGPGDISFTGSTVNTAGAAVSVTGSGANYTVSVDNLGPVQGNLVATVPIGAASDALGNANRASTSTDNMVFVDTAPPTVTVNQTAGQADPTVIQPIAFTIIFSETVTGFNAADVSLAGSTANVSAANVQVIGTGSVYHILVRNITSSGIVRAAVVGGAAQDSFGHFNLPSVAGDNAITLLVDRWKYDYDGDGKSDLSLRRPADNIWHILRATAGYMAMEFGVAGDVLAPADYDGDGKTDVAMFRPSTGWWFIFNSGSQSFQTFSWGSDGDMPVPADHDGDGKADLVVFRPSTNTWYSRFSLTNTFSTVGFGAAGDKPLVGDFDGDGRADIALYRPSERNWYILKTGFGFFIQTWGEAGDIPVPADYDGDGSTDVAVFRPSTGQWFRIRSTAGFDVVNWGASGDKPVPADYDGDGKADVAVFRPSNGTWYIVGSTAGQIINSFGQDGDLPTQGAFIY